jgi:hypothetical protein
VCFQILDGTEDHIKEMIHTSHKNHTDRHNKEEESGGVPVPKRHKQQSLLNFTVRSGGSAVVSFLEAYSQTDPADVVDVSMEQVISDEMDTYQCKPCTVRIPDRTRSQVCEVCTLEDPDEWWSYQRKIGNSFPLLYEVCQCVSSRPMSSGQIERDFGASSNVLTRKHGSTDPRYFQDQSTTCVNFPWIPVPEEMPVTVMSVDRLFVDSDGDYGEETCGV